MGRTTVSVVEVELGPICNLCIGIVIPKFLEKPRNLQSFVVQFILLFGTFLDGHLGHRKFGQPLETNILYYIHVYMYLDTVDV